MQCNRLDFRLLEWKTFLLTIVLLTLAAAVPLYAEEGIHPKPGRQPLDENGRMRIGSEDRCPVCGMKVDQHRKFASAIQLNDNTTYYFCGTGCMIRSWMHPDIFLGVDETDLKMPIVREYFTGREVDARHVIWVAGSDVVGPMGPALVPLKDERSMKVFMQRHGGKTHFRLEQMDDARWFSITGKKARK